MIAVGALVVLGFALVAVLRGPALLQPNLATPAEVPKAEVRVLQGSVRAAERLELKAPAAGKIAALGASEGLTVTVDQLIVQIDSATVRQQVRAAEANLRQVQSRVRKSKASKIREQLALAEMQAQSAAAQRKQADQALADFQTQKPETATALQAGEQAERAAVLTAKQYAAASAAAEAAQKRANETGKPDPEIERLQSVFRQRRAQNAEAQAHLNATRRNHLRLREALEQRARLQRNAESAQRLEQQFAAALTKLQQSPGVKAALEGDALVQAAQAAVQAAEGTLAECAINAPETGRLSELRVRPGTTVQAGQTLAILERQGGARMVFEVPAKQVTALAVGQKAQVSPEGWKPFAAVISQIAPGPKQTRVYLQPLGETPLPATGTALVARLR